jgi:hypothetical protein
MSSINITNKIQVTKWMLINLATSPTRSLYVKYPIYLESYQMTEFNLEKKVMTAPLPPNLK